MIAVRVQIAKPSAIRRANIWEGEKNSNLMLLSGLLNWEELEITDPEKSGSQAKLKSPQTWTGCLRMNGSRQWFSAM